jgi:hypothetical protein
MFLCSPDLKVTNYTSASDFTRPSRTNPKFLPHILETSDVLMGHFGYIGDLLWPWRSQVVVLSVIRDPVSRILSQFKYIKGTPTHPIHHELADLSFEDAWTHHPRFRRMSSNSQLRVLCNGSQPSDFFEAAKDFDYVVGTFAQLNAFRQAAGDVLGVSLPALQRLNTTPDTQEDPVLSDKILHEIHDANAQDQSLVDIISRRSGGLFLSDRLSDG